MEHKTEIFPAVREVTRYLDKLGNSHETRTAAQHANGLAALTTHIQNSLEDGRVDERQLSYILDNFQEWYVTYLEATNER